MFARSLLVAIAILVAAPAFPQSPPSRGWLDVNFISVRPSQEDQTYTFRRTISGEVATAATAYPDMPAGKGRDFGGGVRFGAFGVGLHFLGIDYEYPVGMAVNIPHPLFFNRFATDADTTAGALTRKDRGLDIMATFFVPTPDAWSVRVFGGPSYFNVSQEMVETIRYNQVFNLLGANVVDITPPTTREVEGTAWGFNVGADVGYFFSRHVGVGGIVRFNGATVAIDKEPLTQEAAELKAGSAAFGGGLRLRF